MLSSHDLWWNGPPWLKSFSTTWPKRDPAMSVDATTARKKFPQKREKSPYIMWIVRIVPTIVELDSASPSDSLCSKIYEKFEAKKKFVTWEKTIYRGFRVARSHPPLIPIRTKSSLFERMQFIEQERTDSKVQCTKSIKTYARRRFSTWRAVT